MVSWFDLYFITGETEAHKGTVVCGPGHSQSWRSTQHHLILKASLLLAIPTILIKCCHLQSWLCEVFISIIFTGLDTDPRTPS